jgi:type I restriction-modification system DNA methylase subunit
MVHPLFIEDEDILTTPGIVKTMYDPACVTGGMLAVAEDQLRALNPSCLSDRWRMSRRSIPEDRVLDR